MCVCIHFREVEESSEVHLEADIVLVVAVLCRPPNSDNNVLTGVNEYTGDFINPRRKPILTGDFNVAKVDWLTQTLDGDADRNSELLL